MQDSSAFMDALNTASEAVTTKRSAAVKTAAKVKLTTTADSNTTSSNLINKTSLTDSVNLINNNLVLARVNFKYYLVHLAGCMHLNLILHFVINEKHSKRTCCKLFLLCLSVLF